MAAWVERQRFRLRGANILAGIARVPRRRVARFGTPAQPREMVSIARRAVVACEVQQCARATSAPSMPRPSRPL
eukprot:11086159-Lingulodinium_polyedra.AAC.1